MTNLTPPTHPRAQNMGKMYRNRIQVVLALMLVAVALVMIGVVVAAIVGWRFAAIASVAAVREACAGVYVCHGVRHWLFSFGVALLVNRDPCLASAFLTSLQMGCLPVCVLFQQVYSLLGILATVATMILAGDRSNMSTDKCRMAMLLAQVLRTKRAPLLAVSSVSEHACSYIAPFATAPMFAG